MEIIDKRTNKDDEQELHPGDVVEVWNTNLEDNSFIMITGKGYVYLTREAAGTFIPLPITASSYKHIRKVNAKLVLED